MCDGGGVNMLLSDTADNKRGSGHLIRLYFRVGNLLYWLYHYLTSLGENRCRVGDRGQNWAPRAH